MTLLLRWLGRVTLALALVSWGLPHFISSSPLRNRMVNASLIGVGLEAEAETASFGWFAPTRMKGLKVVSTDSQVDVRAEELRISQAWWQLILFPHQLGHLEITKPSVTLLLDSDEVTQLSLGEISPFTANLEDAEFNLQLGDKPIISVGGLSINLRIADEGTSFLEVEPGRVFDHRPLTTETCDSLLRLLDPILADVLQVEGHISLDVDRLHVPLDVLPEEQIQQLDCEGFLHLHGVELRAKTPLLQRIVRVASDLYGKQPSDAIHVVDENQIHLQVHEGRIHFDELVLGFPEISPDLNIHAKGSLGMDGSLDLWVTLPEVFVAEDIKTVNRTAVVQMYVSGTVDEPRIERISRDELDARRRTER